MNTNTTKTFAARITEFISGPFPEPSYSWLRGNYTSETEFKTAIDNYIKTNPKKFGSIRKIQILKNPIRKNSTASQFVIDIN